MYGANANITDDFDADAQAQSEAEVVNISDEVQRFLIATQPGSKPRPYRLEPFGKPGCSIHIQAGYTQPYKGAGQAMVRPTIESISEREMISEIVPTPQSPGRPAVRLPMIVQRAFADNARARYLAAKEKAADASTDALPTILLQTEHGVPVRARMQRAAAPVVEDVEDQATPLDEPPPDDDMPPITIGATETAPDSGGKGKRR